MSPLFQVTFSLTLVLALILLAFKLLQRFQGKRTTPASLLRIRSSISVGPREKVVLLEVQGQQLLIGVASGQVRLLTQLSDMHSMPGTGDLFAQGEALESPTTSSTDSPQQTQPRPSWLKAQLDKFHAR